jgi:hypothetical protein
MAKIMSPDAVKAIVVKEKKNKKTIVVLSHGPVD